MLQLHPERWDPGKPREALARFLNAKECDPQGGECERLRNDAVVEHLSLVRYLAQRFANRGEPLEDLMQVGTIGLIKAIDRFDSRRGVEFTTYATPTIVGEIKRHFRDKGWAIRMPRRLQELNLAVNRAIDEFAVRYGRSPTARDLANHLHATEEEVLQAQEAGSAYHAVSLDAPGLTDDGRMNALEEFVGEIDPSFVRLEDAISVERAFRILEGRERMLVLLRFYDQMPQTEIARRLNVSQMHVSRLQQKALEKMRQTLNR